MPPPPFHIQRIMQSLIVPERIPIIFSACVCTVLADGGWNRNSWGRLGRVNGLSRKRVCPPHPPGIRKGGQHSLAGEGAGGANSDDWRGSLAHCILCWGWCVSLFFTHVRVKVEHSLLVMYIRHSNCGSTYVPLVSLCSTCQREKV